MEIGVWRETRWLMVDGDLSGWSVRGGLVFRHFHTSSVNLFKLQVIG